MTSETVQDYLQDAQDALGAFLATLLDEGATLELDAPTETDAAALQDELERGLAVGADDAFVVVLDRTWVSLISESMLGRSISVDDEGVDDLFREITAQGYGTLRNQLSASGTTLPELAIQPSLPGTPPPSIPEAAWRVPFHLAHEGTTYEGYALLPQSDDPAPAEEAPPEAEEPSAQPTAVEDEREAQPSTEKAAGGSGVSVSPAKFSDLGEETIHGPRAEENNFDLFAEVELEVSVELGRRLLPLADVLQLTNGSVIELEKLVGEPLSIYANGRFVAEGEAVVIDEKFGIRITNLAPKKQRSEALL